MWVRSIMSSISSSSLLSGEWGSRAENVQLLIKAWSFWWPAPIQEPTKSPPIRTKGTVNTQEIPRDLGTLCQEPGAETNIYIFYYLTASDIH